jgi:threonine dehydrogenase-like Zn-dependent dehydrogenase
MVGTHSTHSTHNSHPGLVQKVLDKQVNHDKRVTHKGPTLTKEEKAAEAAQAKAQLAKKIMTLERAIAAEDAIDMP